MIIADIQWDEFSIIVCKKKRHHFSLNVWYIQVHQEAQLKLKELTEKYGREDDFDIDFGSDLEDNFEDNNSVNSEDDE